MTSGIASVEMPRYVSHKEVWALQIRSVTPVGDAIKLSFVLGDIYAERIVTAEELSHKPVPKIGWYMVVYKDGYLSFSPGEQFEEGYKRCP
jgi:hypothetical protein